MPGITTVDLTIRAKTLRHFGRLQPGGVNHLASSGSEPFGASANARSLVIAADYSADVAGAAARQTGLVTRPEPMALSS